MCKWLLDHRCSILSYELWVYEMEVSSADEVRESPLYIVLT